MYIRQTKTNNTATGEAYFTYRLVRTERIAGRVRQVTLLNLGRHFSVPQESWPVLCSRIEQLLSSQEGLFDIECPAAIEQAAQRYYGRLVAGALPKAEEEKPSEVGTVARKEIEAVDINSLQLLQPRSVGVEHVALHALTQLGMIGKLAELGLNGVQRTAIMSAIVGRMANPASELATWEWLRSTSALGELLDVDFASFPLINLYRASDLLMQHRKTLEEHLFSAVRNLFSLEETVTLYDLSNTYFEGNAISNPKAQRGPSKEKRSDCPLLTLGLVLDGSGFVRRSQTFAGNIAEGETLKVMLTRLSAPMGALVIMDAGIASQKNLTWLKEHGYRYLVVRRGGRRQFDESRSVTIMTASKEELCLQKEIQGDEVFLYCHSLGRETKERAMVERFEKAFESGLQKLVEGLQKPRAEKRPERLQERIGRLREKSHGVGQHYTITLTTDDSGKKVTALTWEKSHVEGTMATHPGVYCLRSSETDWDEEKLWRTYTLLTDLESVFRSLKSELGLRPIFHQKEERSDGHLFITVLAYQCVQYIRKTLQQSNIQDSWSNLRHILSVQRRVTTTLRKENGQTLPLRQSTQAEPALRAIYQALGISTSAGRIKKLLY
jgi:transposase